MLTSPIRLSLCSLAVLCLPLAAHAQFQMAPGLAGANPYRAGAGNPYPGNGGFYSQGAAGRPYGSNPYTSQARMSSSSLPYGNLGGYYNYNPYIMPFSNYGAAGGFMIGAAAAIDSSGKLMLSTSQAKLMNEQLKRDRIGTRRMIIEEWLWERNNLPTLQDENERIQRISLRRMQNDPPLTEIISGQALNEIMTDIQRHPGTLGPDIPLNEETLRKINVTPAGKGVNLGPLKNEGRLSWPIALRSGDFKRERDLLNQLAIEAFQEASKGHVAVAVINQMNEAEDKMLAGLGANIREMGPSKYIEAKRFLTELKDATRGLERNDVANFFNNKYSAKGRTVAELAKNMTHEGLKFAPVVGGDESAYVALHRLLAAYDVSLNGGGAVVDQRQPQP